MMKKKSDVDFSPISCVPDDVVFAILSKLMDLKTLCLCKLVSKRFHAIVHHVDTIRVIRPIRGFKQCFESIGRFKRLKSLCIMVLDIPYSNDIDGNLFKWEVKTGFNRIDYFVMVLPTSIYDKKGLLLYEEKDKADKFFIAVRRLADALWRVLVSRGIVMLDFPFLEKISITDSHNWGRVSVNGRETIDELRNWKSVTFPHRVSECYLPSLKLPVSGYVMKGVSLFLVENKELPDDGNYDRFIDDHDQIDYDKEEAAYHEAMMEIFKKHKGSIVRKPPNHEWEARISSFLEEIIRPKPV